jgi:hypothetical protein
VSENVQKLPWLPAGARAAAVLGIAILGLTGCGGGDPAAQRSPTGSSAGLPDACGLVDKAALTDLLGKQTGPPKPEGTAEGETRACTWLAPSDKDAKASLIIRLFGGRQWGADESTRAARARDYYAKAKPLDGRCDQFQTATYQACGYLHKMSLTVVALKGDRVISAVATSDTYKSLDRKDASAEYRALAEHVTARLH